MNKLIPIFILVLLFWPTKVEAQTSFSASFHVGHGRHHGHVSVGHGRRHHPVRVYHHPVRVVHHSVVCQPVGYYEYRTRRVLVSEGYFEKYWVPEVVEVRYDEFGDSYRVVRGGYYVKRWVPARYVKRVVRVWVSW